MRQMRFFGLVAGVAAVALGLGAVALAGDNRRPRPVDVRAGGEQVRASQGSWCYSGPRTGICADYGYPLRVRGRLDVAPGQRIKLRMHDRSIKRLSASLLKVRDGEIDQRVALTRIRRAPNNPRAWRATIPADAADANRLDISVRYKRNRGDSNWWAGIRLAGQGESRGARI